MCNKLLATLAIPGRTKTEERVVVCCIEDCMDTKLARNHEGFVCHYPLSQLCLPPSCLPLSVYLPPLSQLCLLPSLPALFSPPLSASKGSNIRPLSTLKCSGGERLTESQMFAQYDMSQLPLLILFCNYQPLSLHLSATMVTTFMKSTGVFLLYVDQYTKRKWVFFASQ